MCNSFATPHITHAFHQEVGVWRRFTRLGWPPPESSRSDLSRLSSSVPSSCQLLNSSINAAVSSVNTGLQPSLNPVVAPYCPPVTGRLSLPPADWGTWGHQSDPAPGQSGEWAVPGVRWLYLAAVGARVRRRGYPSRSGMQRSRSGRDRKWWGQIGVCRGFMWSCLVRSQREVIGVTWPYSRICVERFQDKKSKHEKSNVKTSNAKSLGHILTLVVISPFNPNKQTKTRCRN